MHLRVESCAGLQWLSDYWSLVHNFRCIGSSRAFEILHAILTHTDCRILRLILNLLFVDLLQFGDFGRLGLAALQLPCIWLAVSFHENG